MERTSETASARCGFTLIELVAVVTLLGLFAGIVMFSVRGHLQNARLVQTASRLESLDRQARDDARKAARVVRIIWDRRSQEARFQRDDDARASAATRRVRLGHQLEMVDVLIGGRAGADDTVAISPSGQSDTYAVKLSAPNGATLWLVALGMTGQHLRFETEEEMRAVLEL